MISNFSFSDDTIGFLVEGDFNSDTVTTFIEEIMTKLKKFDNINLYIEDTGIKTFSIPAIIEELFFKLKHNDQFNKVALVSNQQWTKACGNLYSFFSDSEFKNYASENRIEALSWIAE